MKKLDLTKLYKSYYRARTTPELVNIEPAHFLSLTGKGDPSGKPFSEKLQALYATAYTIKFAHKQSGRISPCRNLNAYGGMMNTVLAVLLFLKRPRAFREANGSTVITGPDS